MKEIALRKLLNEVENQKNPAVHTIHNWLCDQEDNELFEKVASTNKSILQAVQYCINNAQKVQIGNAAIADNDTVFNWVREYYLSNETNVEAKAHARVSTSSESTQESVAKTVSKKENKKKSKTKELKADENQISLLDFL